MPIELPPESTPPKVGARIRWLRETLGLNQGEFARAVGTKQTALSNWEIGVALLPLAAAVRIKALYGVSLDWLYRGEADRLPDAIFRAWATQSTTSSSENP